MAQFVSIHPPSLELVNVKSLLLQMHLLRTPMAVNQILTSIWKAGCIMQSNWCVLLRTGQGYH